jgi:hypothetical protein
MLTEVTQKGMASTGLKSVEARMSHSRGVSAISGGKASQGR